MNKIDTILDTSKEWYHEDKENHIILSLLLNKEQNTFSGYAGGMKIEDMASLLHSYMLREENFVTAIEIALNYYHKKVK